MLNFTRVSVSGDRFRAAYRLAGTEKEARTKAADICIEQTIEFPPDLVPDDDIRAHVFGQVEDFRPLGANSYQAIISFAIETTAFEIPQLLNVLLGNISLKPGIRVEWFDIPEGLLKEFPGPRFGRVGLRELLQVHNRPLLSATLKPMGLPIEVLADFAYQFARGGIDLVKDDHGLTNQPFSPFKERVERCAEAVAKANRKTGGHTLYLANVIGPADNTIERALFAKEAGAGGVLISPGLTGFDAMARLAENPRLKLPILCHPAFLGSLIVSQDHGISHYALFGQLTRLTGADMIIFPNYGGRFAFTKEQCASIKEGIQVPMEHIKPIFPAPSGGMSLDRVQEMIDFYGQEIVLMIGGDLHRHGNDLAATAERFRKLAENS